MEFIDFQNYQKFIYAQEIKTTNQVNFVHVMGHYMYTQNVNLDYNKIE